MNLWRLYLLFYAALGSLYVEPFSLDRGFPLRKGQKSTFLTRRTTLETAATILVTALTIPSPSNAACLMGDTSTDCIGVYKMPMDDNALKYVETPETLKQFAPDVRWVPPVQYPKSYKEAKSELESLQRRCVALSDEILKGDLTSVGVEILGIIPRLIVDGRVVISSLENAKTTNGIDLSMKAYRAESSHTELVNKLGQCDILIGQSLRGELGAPAPAQLLILGELKEANELFDEFMRSIPDDFKPKK